jgi:hypothetical protein
MVTLAAILWGVAIVFFGLVDSIIPRTVVSRRCRVLRYDLGDLPRVDLEPDDPELSSRAPGEYRDDELPYRPDARKR